MEGLHLPKDMQKENDYMCKIDLNDTYFCVALHRKHWKYIRFCWEGQLYEFLGLCFGLEPVSRIFTKLLKIHIKWINIWIIVSLDDMLLMRQKIEDLNMGRNTLIFLLQQLGFRINLKKPVLSATQKLELLGLEIDSVNMTLTLPMGKEKGLTQKCRNLMENLKPTLWKITSLIVSLCSAAQPAMPAFLQIRYLQQQHVEYTKTVSLPLNNSSELKFNSGTSMISNLEISNGKSILSPINKTIQKGA